MSFNQLWDGYCPESALEGKQVKMRLNEMDFYESEETGLQICVYGPQAIVLDFKGKGKFRQTVTFGHDQENGEMLSPQNTSRPPFNDPAEVFENEEDFREYIKMVNMVYQLTKNDKPKLKEINPELVKRYIEKFDADKISSSSDNALNLLLEQWPTNTQSEAILLKVTAINRLYSTSVYDIHSIANHIFRQVLDSKLKSGDLSCVDSIAKGHKIPNSKSNKERYFYSFATKYCSWHNPEAYPMYDNYVAKILLAYQKSESNNTKKYTETNLKSYPNFVDCLNEFISNHNLNQFTYKEIDKFLWVYGKELF